LGDCSDFLKLKIAHIFCYFLPRLRLCIDFDKYLLGLYFGRFFSQPRQVTLIVLAGKRERARAISVELLQRVIFQPKKKLFDCMKWQQGEPVNQLSRDRRQVNLLKFNAAKAESKRKKSQTLKSRSGMQCMLGS
jgi:hypothetical protein